MLVDTILHSIVHRCAVMLSVEELKSILHNPVQYSTVQYSTKEFSRAFANSGHSYHKAKKELSQFKEVDPVEIIKRKGKGRQEQRSNRRGCIAFWNAPFDPRMPPPRVLNLYPNTTTISRTILLPPSCSPGRTLCQVPRGQKTSLSF